MTTTETTITDSADVEYESTPGNVAHLTATQFADAVAMVKPHLGTDDTLPQLTCYRLDERNGDLWLSATDRYSAAAARIEPARSARTDLTQQFPAGFHAVIPGSLAQRATSIFKPNRRHPMFDPHLAVKVTARQVLVEERTFDVDLEPVRLAAQPPAPPPDMLTLLHGLLDACRTATDRIDRASFNARFFARFAGVPKACGEPNLPLTLRQSAPTGPLIATFADRFVGALMPVRLVNEADDLAEWVARLTAREGSTR